MPVMTPESIKNYAVSAVEAFINARVPLSDTIAAIAETEDLNVDQIKRLVEASNQIAYLKLQTMAVDRTFEFPLADFKEVTAKLVQPSETLSKEASMAKASPMSIVSGSEGMIKAASESKTDPAEFVKSASKAEQTTWLHKSLVRNMAELEKLAQDCDYMVQRLTSAVEVAKKDPEFMDKLAHVADEVTFKALAKFSGSDMEKSAEAVLFRDADLVVAKELNGLYKQAKEMIVQRDELAGKLEKAANILDGLLEKEAFAGKIVKKL